LGRRPSRHGSARPAAALLGRPARRCHTELEGPGATVTRLCLRL